MSDDRRRRSLFGYEPPAAESRDEGKWLSVSDVNRAARKTLESQFPNVGIRAEIGDAKLGPSGHLYFTLKDDRAEIDAVMWSSKVRRLNFRPATGLEVRVRGGLGLYEPRGRFQLMVEEMEEAGLGALERRFRELFERYRKSGAFAEDRKKPLPFLPRRIALLTSARGAAVRDMITAIHARFPQMPLLIADARVQGPGAAAELADRLAEIDARGLADVCILGRGGGSLEDLWAFNEPILVDAVLSAEIPIVSAVGHEVDQSLTDFVADVRAATPTAAGVLVVPERASLDARLDDMAERAQGLVGRRCENETHRLDLLARSPGMREPKAQLAWAHQDLDARSLRLRGALKRRCEIAGAALDGLARRQSKAVLALRLAAADQEIGRLTSRAEGILGRRIETARARHRELTRAFESLSPRRVLERGYAILRRDEHGEVLRSAGEAKIGETLRVELSEGALDVEVRAEAERSIED